jgi:excinuclease UvrABC nuclease subunit
MQLRKSAKHVRDRARLLTDAKFSVRIPVEIHTLEKLPESPGVYVISAAEGKTSIYAGETSNLRQRIANQFSSATRPLWKDLSSSLIARYFPTSCVNTDRIAYQRRVIARHSPLLNLHDQTIA